MCSTGSSECLLVSAVFDAHIVRLNDLPARTVSERQTLETSQPRTLDGSTKALKITNRS